MLAILECDTADVEPLRKSLAALAVEPVGVAHADGLTRVSKLIIPRVHSVARAARSIRDNSLVAPLLRVFASGTPVLAIDSGFHLLFDVCHDGGQHTGLGVVPGKVAPIELGHHPAARHFSLPHQGWNQVHWTNPCPITTGIASGEYFFFDHALHAEPLDARMVLGRTNHGIDFNAFTWSGSVFGTQFIPERSKEAGLKLFANFLAV
jgi:imidazole glycerol-phosphate synthase subunit HisH